MAGTIHLDVVTPDRMVVSEDVDIVMAQGALGEFGVLPGHTQFVTSLVPGELRYRIGGQAQYLAVTGGFAEVGPTKVTVLAEAAERAAEIDIERARRAKERAEERLRSRERIDYARAQAALQRALARLRVAERR